MIKAIIFDMDGTLVQTEKLKALSYARAAVDLCPDALDEEEVVDAFKDVVGRPRRDVAKALMERFDLKEAAADQMDAFGVSKPWQAYVQIRLQYYEEMLEDPAVLRENQWPHNMELLERSLTANCRVALATSSTCERTQHVLQVLGLTEKFDFIATADDVERSKPEPEIYELVTAELAVSPAECVVIEDSPSGVKAAVAAGMHCVAVTTPFTRAHLHEQDVLAERWIVDDSEQLLDTVDRLLAEEGTPAGR